MQHIYDLKVAIQELEMKLEKEKNKYLELTESRKESSEGMSALPYFQAMDSMVLQEDGSYILSLEMETPMDVVIVQSDIKIDVLDSEKNSAVVSFSQTENQEVLATFRCQSNTTSLSIKIHSAEGEYGTLRTYIITRLQPKGCILKTYDIKPLSAHKRSYRSIERPDTINTLQVTGGFSLNEAFNWIQQALPEAPEKISGQTAAYSFVSTLTGTLLTCNISKGSLSFASDNVSTISIVKDFVAREATKKAIQIEMSVSVSQNSIPHTIRLLYPKIRRLVYEKETSLLKESIMTEIMTSDPEVAQQMLDDLQTSSDGDDHTIIGFDRMTGLIIDLLIDYHKLKGRASKSALAEIQKKIPDLRSTLNSCVVNGVPVECDIFVQKLVSFWGFEKSS